MKMSKFGNSRFPRFLRHNGVYFALAIGLAAICLVGLYGAVQSGSEKRAETGQQPVEQLVTNQPDDRTSTTTTATKNTTTTTATEKKELYVFPLSNAVQKPFSSESPAYSETMKDWRLHLGVDFEGEIGQTVKATAQGVVAEITADKLWGSVVTIDHGVGVLSRYCGVTPSVNVGDEVEASTPIGKLAEIPCELTQAPHLHMEMTVDGTPIDPIAAIGLDASYGDNIGE